MPTPLSVYHRRLVIENYLRLDVGDAVVVLISPMHPSFLTWAPLLQAYTDQPLALFSSAASIRSNVKSHPEREKLYHNGLSVDAFKSLMTVAGGGALVLSACNSNIDIQLKYCDVFDCHPSAHRLQVWSQRKHNSNVCRALEKMTDTNNQQAMLLRFYDELFSDAGATHALSSAYSRYLTQQAAELNLKGYKEGNISTAKIRSNFRLPASDSAFVAFRALVDLENKNSDFVVRVGKEERYDARSVNPFGDIWYLVHVCFVLCWDLRRPNSSNCPLQNRDRGRARPPRIFGRNKSVRGKR
jgi:hypothetical protein